MAYTEKNLGNILVLTYWNFDDALIQTYTLPYLELIRTHQSATSKIFLVTLEKGPSIKGVRENVERRLGPGGVEWVRLRYTPFGFLAIARWAGMIPWLLGFVFRKKIEVIHCFATPAGAAGYVLSLLSGRKLVLDSYEPHAEAMVENGTWKKSGMAFRILFWFEKKQTERAVAVIAASEGMRSYARSKYHVEIKRFAVKPACVNLDHFSVANIKNPKLLREMELEDKIVCVYAGKLGGIYLDLEVFEFLRVAHEYWGDSFRFLFLTNQSRHEIEAFCYQARLDIGIITTRFVPHHEIPQYLGLADFAITPVKPVPSKRYCTPIKDGEYWATGLPVVISKNISDDSAIVANLEIGAVLEQFDTASYQKAIEIIDRLLKRRREETFQKIREVARTYRSFKIAEEAYQAIYPGLKSL
ncbi:MAG: glycosyltransferase [Cytophagales bacterium]|nr:glycosyltransferase [Cytophagales bacterium]